MRQSSTPGLALTKTRSKIHLKIKDIGRIIKLYGEQSVALIAFPTTFFFSSSNTYDVDPTHPLLQDADVFDVFGRQKAIQK